jgi:hypothetical protein
MPKRHEQPPTGAGVHAAGVAIRSNGSGYTGKPQIRCDMQSLTGLGCRPWAEVKSDSEIVRRRVSQN